MAPKQQTSGVGVDAFSSYFKQDALAPPPSQRGPSFLHPNEEYPQQAKGILECLPTGSYISVGTERAFMAAALSPNVKHLELWDRSPEAIFFNRINIFLQAVSNDTADYRNLRLHAESGEWKRAYSSYESEPPVLIDEAFKWWVKNVRANPRFEQFNRKPEQKDQPFFGTNYMHREDLFQKLHGMARNGRIRVEQVALEDSDRIGELVDGLRKEGLRIGGIDISNAWHYISLEALESALDKFLPVTSSESILITTTQSDRKWHYSGFTIGGLTLKSGEASLSDHQYFRRPYFAAHVNKARDRYFGTIDGVTYVETPSRSR